MRICRVARLISLMPIVAAVACGGSKKPAESPASTTAAEGNTGPAEVGKPAPDLSIQSLNGKGDVKLGSLSGKIVVVDFWATWCGPCKQSFPALEALSKRHGEKLAVVGVSVNDEIDGVADFAKEMGTTFPIGLDQGHAIAQRWNVATMPTSFVVDDKGTVRFVHAGYHDGDEAEIEKEVTSLIGDAGGSNAKSGDTKPTATDTPAAATDPPPEEKPAATDPPADAKPAKPSKKKGTKKKKPKKKPTTTTT